MDGKFSLNSEDLHVESYSVAPSGTEASIQPVDSYPAVCTCIGICQPTADIYCSGGCPPEYTVPVIE